MANEVNIQVFKKQIWDFYKQNKRDLVWRHPEPDGIYDPYKILVSEMMLQQTQVSRVTPKYLSFLSRFPNIKALAHSDLSQVLVEWSGLGYNRRAKYIHQTAMVLVSKYGAVVPDSIPDLVTLPGIGPNTAAAILVYSFNLPAVFIETNIRTVFLHHFFRDEDTVSDQTLLPLIMAALDTKQLREWYYALMDYGSYLKQTGSNPNIRSKHFTPQSKFSGSRRQIRGQIIKLLTDRDLTIHDLEATIVDVRLSSVLKDLQTEELIIHKGKTYRLGK